MVLWPFIYNFRLHIKDLYRICINLCTVHTSVSPVASPAHLDPCLAEALIQRSLGHEPWAMKARDVTNSSIPAKQIKLKTIGPSGRTGINQAHHSVIKQSPNLKGKLQTTGHHWTSVIAASCLFSLMFGHTSQTASLHSLQ